MNANDLLRVIESNVRHTKEQGANSISLANLEAYLKHLAKDVSVESDKTAAMTAIEMENLKANLNQWLDDQKRSHEVRIEMLRAVVATGQAALKSALLINSGATVALLAFVGHVWSTPDAVRVIPLITASVFLYTLGVFTAACAAGATYFAQAGYGNEFGANSHFIGRIGHGAALSLTLSAYGLFLWASVKVALTLGMKI